ncbi:Transcription regulatory protein SNF5 [Spatholobus suberectus]|nr:Transcription regulatory protein SNF5 [Spatholobus suberectus]
MVQLMGSRKLRSDLEAGSVKLEIEEHGPLNKRFKPSSASQEQWNASNSTSFGSPSQYNILDEPSPLGLRLRKSPSLLDLIQMKLSRGNMFIANAQNENFSSGVKKESRGAAASGSAEKLKASNFPASLLIIGSWEYKSKHEGDLVAKCYFAKHKLVWEVLEGELKRKMEIQWSDIMALKANCPDTGPSSLTVVLARQPLFFRETNPQPRKHTLWQTTSDFTDGEASKHRQHFLEFPQGVLAKHFEKLIQCDRHLNFLSQQPEIILDSAHFDTRPAAFENLDNPEDRDLHLVNGKESTTSCSQDIGSPHSSLSPSFKIEHNDPLGITLDSLPCEAPSPSSGSTSSETDFKGPRNWDQIKLPGLRPSMSVSDFIGHIEHCLSDQITSGNPSFCAGRPGFQEMLEEIAQHLLNDNQVITTSDEKSLMSRVNSLCSLLQKDPAAVQNSHDKESSVEGPDGGKNIQLSHDHESMQNKKIKMDVKSAEEDLRDVCGGKQVLGMSRKDSFGELLLHLPRIASLSKFLFDISEEDSDS